MKMLDLAKFQKVKEDKDKVTMRHKDGHEMTILVGALPKIHREQLKRLKMADGGEATNSDDSSDASAAQDNSQGKAGTNITINAAPQPGQQSNTLAQPAQIASPPNPTLDQLAAQGTPKTPVDQNLGNPTNAALTAGQGVQLGQQAGNLEQQVAAAKGQGTVPLTQQAQANAQAYAQRLDQTRMDMDQHTKDFANYVAQNPIDKNAMFENMSTPSKITNALGLLFGGFTGGFSGTGQNPALNWLQDQQNKDIQAQKDRMGQQKTVWEAYQQMYNNHNVSDALTAKSWNDMLSARANQLDAQLATPQSHAANLALQSKILLDNNDKLQKAAFFANQPQGGGLGGAQTSDVINRTQAAPINGGASGAPGAPSGQTQPDRILKPNAMQMLNNYARTATADPAATAQLQDARQQYQNAYQADKALAQIDAIFPLAAQNTTVAGSVANALEGTVGKVPFGIGEVLGNLPGEAIRDLGGQKEKQEQAYRAQLEGYIDSALANTGATPTDKAEMARKYFPNESDDAETRAVKLKGLKDKIINLQHTGTIDTLGMTNNR